MVKKSWVTFVLATTLVGLTGCADNNDRTANNIDNMNSASNMNDNNVNNATNNTINGLNTRTVRNERNVSNQNLRVSNRASNNVERLSEVDEARVIIRNNDAYVAVRLTTNQNGNRAHGGTTGTGPNTNATYGSGYNSGTTGTNGASNMTATTGTRNNTDGTIVNTNRANNNTRGTATGTRGTNNASLEQRIINQVRAADRNIDHVYVSYDTDTFGQMTNYSNDIRNGNNRDGLWNDFTNAVDRMF